VQTIRALTSAQSASGLKHAESLNDALQVSPFSQWLVSLGLFLYLLVPGNLLASLGIPYSLPGGSTIIGAVHSGKPMVLLPRRVDYHEARNSHQLDSAHRLIGQPGIFIADQTADLPACIADALMAPAVELAPNDHLTSLISRLRQFIEFEPAD
jgi:hypothetical protein